MDFTLRQLEYAVALADTLSFREAAEHCHVSQPGLSMQLKKLEDTLGLQLFERDRRGVRITAPGEEFIGRARRLLVDARELGEIARARTAPLVGDVRLGVIPTVAPYLLPPVMNGLREPYPDLRLLLVEDRTPDLVRMLHSGRLDVLLLALEVELGDATAMALFADDFELAVPRGHELADREQVTEADLEAREILLLEDGHCLRDHALAVCSRGGAGEYGTFRATSLGTLIQMVSNGIGITLVPEMAKSVELRDERDVVSIPFADPAPGRTIGLAWRRSSARDHEFRLLGEAIRDQRA